MLPNLWIVAGPNGAGKTTSTQQLKADGLFPGTRFLNPDDRTRSKLIAMGYQGFTDAPFEVQFETFKESANEVQAELELAIENGEDVGIETVLSTDKYQSLVRRVMELRGSFGLIYFALESPAIAIKRVVNRVIHGGHDVPPDKIAKRWKESLARLSWYARQASAFFVFDNSRSDPNAPVGRLVCHGDLGRVAFMADDCFTELRVALEQL